jgi:hypothetical protein
MKPDLEEVENQQLQVGSQASVQGETKVQKPEASQKNKPVEKPADNPVEKPAEKPQEVEVPALPK